MLITCTTFAIWNYSGHAVLKESSTVWWRGMRQRACIPSMIWMRWFHWKVETLINGAWNNQGFSEPFLRWGFISVEYTRPRYEMLTTEMPLVQTPLITFVLKRLRNCLLREWQAMRNSCGNAIGVGFSSVVNRCEWGFAGASWESYWFGACNEPAHMKRALSRL